MGYLRMSRIKPAESEVGHVEGVVKVKGQEKEGLNVRTDYRLVAGAFEGRATGSPYWSRAS